MKEEKKTINTELNDKPNMPIPYRNIKLLIIGLLVMVAGYIMMVGGASSDPKVFSYNIFSFRHLVAAPIIIIIGIVIEIIAILKH